MNKPVLLLLLVLLMPVNALAIDLPFLGGGDKDKAEDTENPEKEKSTFVVHFKNGGSMETDNYTVTKEHVVVMMDSGAVYLDRKMVTSIEEVAGPEQEPIQTIEVEAPKPAPAKNNSRPSKEVELPPPPVDTTPRDDEGHTEAWWQERVTQWRDKKADAEQRLKQAQDEWSAASGALTDLTRQVPAPLTPEQRQQKQDDPDSFVQPMTTVGSGYDITRYQDLRGSSRIEMDRARADVDEAENMLNNVLPEEARKAGAPPGWVR